MKVTFINNKETAEVDISKCTTVADIIQEIAQNKGYNADCISLVMKGRQLKPSELISKAGVTETSKVIGVLRNIKPASTPVPQPPVSVAPPVPLPKMEPLLMKQKPSPKPEVGNEKKVKTNPVPETNEDYAKRILSSEMLIPLLYNCSIFPRDCEQLLDLIHEKDSRLFNFLLANPNVLTDAIVEASKLPQERIQQAFDQGRANSSQQNDVIHLTEADVNAIQTLMQLGFSQEEATVAYLSCDKNVELAASFLYGN